MHPVRACPATAFPTTDHSNSHVCLVSGRVIDTPAVLSVYHYYMRVLCVMIFSPLTFYSALTDGKGLASKRIGFSRM